MFDLLYKLLHKKVKLHTNTLKKYFTNSVNINNAPNSPYLKLKF